MQEFILIVIVYMNLQSAGFQMLPMGEFPSKKECEEYSVQVRKDLAEPGRTIRATCIPKAAMNTTRPPARKG